MQMNVQLHHVVTDITGATGMKIIRAIVSGVTDPKLLAEHRDPRCKASSETIEQALTGNYRPEHVFALRQALELYEFHQAKVAECDVEVEAVLKTLNENRSPPEKPMPAVRHAGSKNEPDFDVRCALYTLLGADLTQIHGFGAYTVLRLIAECGDDMRKWPTAKHFTSWLGLAPGNKISGGRLLSSKTTRPGGRRDLPGPSSAGEGHAGCLSRQHAPWREPGALRPSTHGRHHLPRRQLSQRRQERPGVSPCPRAWRRLRAPPRDAAVLLPLRSRRTCHDGAPTPSRAAALPPGGPAA